MEFTEKKSKIFEKFDGKKICIVGFAREGKSTYNYIRKYSSDMHLTIIDRDMDLVAKNPNLKEDSNLSFVLGDNYLDNLNQYDLIIKTPGISFKNIDISKIRDKITSQFELALEFYKKNIISITGTKGKSTTTSLIYKIVGDQGRKCYLLGNIGIPIFDFIDDVLDDDIMVIEASAHQLEFVNASPHIGLILNLYEEHLDFYKSKDAYYLAKLNTFKFQDSDDFALYSSFNNTLNDYVAEGRYKSKLVDIDALLPIENDHITYDGKVVYDTRDERYLVGLCQLEDIKFALMVSILLNFDMDKVVSSINEFKPLEHRMEYVGTFDGVKYYNDSIATIPTATINCINSLKDVDTIIFGGLDRGIDYSELIEFFNNCDIENFICMKETGYKLAEFIKNKNVYLASSLEDAVDYAKKVTKNTCVLSPAAPSYNEFKNFEEKGKFYKEYVIKR